MVSFAISVAGSFMHSAVFFMLGVALATAGALVGGWCWALLWPAASFGLVAAAYAGVGPKVFGKRPNGRMMPVNIVLTLPFLAFTWAVWHVARIVLPEPAYHEIIPGLWLGRRLLPKELPEQFKTVVDLTCEFREPEAIVHKTEYICLPTLDPEQA